MKKCLIQIAAALSIGSICPALLSAAVIKQSFSYDASGRLTEVVVSDQASDGEHYNYDASGNIIEQTVNGETVRMTYDAANQLQSRTDASGTTRFLYDRAGRLVEEWRDGETIASYAYGYLDKVTSVTRNGIVTQFHYNARGMLVAKERDGQIVETLGWDGIGLIAKGDTVYANEAHISGGVPLVSASPSGDGFETSYYDSDYLGTTTASYSVEGAVALHEYTSYGQGIELADARFTGKHYDADLGAHVFPYRNYRSSEGRWASADPAGFPDGPNQHFYAPVPTMGLDPLGLQEYDPSNDILLVATVIVGWETFGFDFSARRGNRSLLGRDVPDETAPQAEVNALKTSSKFTNVFNDSYFSNIYDQVGIGNNYSLGSLDRTNVDYNSGLLPSDLGWAYGNLTYSVTGSFYWVTVNGVEGWRTTANFSVSDAYDFVSNSGNPAIAAFERLQTNGFASIYNTNVNFSLMFDEF